MGRESIYSAIWTLTMCSEILCYLAKDDCGMEVSATQKLPMHPLQDLCTELVIKRGKNINSLLIDYSISLEVVLSETAHPWRCSRWGWGLGQPDPSGWQGGGNGWSSRSLPSQAIPWCYETVSPDLAGAMRQNSQPWCRGGQLHVLLPMHCASSGHIPCASRGQFEDNELNVRELDYIPYIFLWAFLLIFANLTEPNWQAVAAEQELVSECLVNITRARHLNGGCQREASLWVFYERCYLCCELSKILMQTLMQGGSTWIKVQKLLQQSVRVVLVECNRALEFYCDDFSLG